MMKSKCEKCGEPIDEKRLVALPDTKVCVKCTDEIPVTGYMSWEHKTAPTIIIGESAEQLRQYDRKGVHAQLPLNNPNNGLLQHHKQNQEAKTNAGREQKLVSQQARVKTERARCHPDRPKVTPDGKCAECAIEWYRIHRR